MKKLTVGLVAHVDAGKTTLAEALLFHSGAIRSAGSVNGRTSVMDAHELEKRRGITIFTGTASLEYAGARMTLLDTPGHIDFSAEAERSILALDAAVLVISGLDGVQAHTVTLWRLLKEYRVPTLLFVSKMDFSRLDEEELLEGLRRELDRDIVRFDRERALREEAAALSDEAMLMRYEREGCLSDEDIASAVMSRRLFPCFFGSGLKNVGTEALLNCLAGLAREYPADGALRAFCFKISRDENEVRLAHIKLLSGSLTVRDSVSIALPDGTNAAEKVTQIRLLKGARFQAAERLEAGDCAALTGLGSLMSGRYFGAAASPEESAPAPRLKPVMSYRLIPEEGADAKAVFETIRGLAEEDPALRLRWNRESEEIEADLMGAVQTEVLEATVLERFGIRISAAEGRILYRETLTGSVEGVGHFEPLRHYAEVHLMMEPLPEGSGLELCSELAEDELARGWQRLILTHLAEKEHRGVLIGAPLSDVRLSLVAGRAHEKHTEGGDFRQATYRAVRQGLMQARAEGKLALLEPMYRFRLQLPAEQLGRAMTDLKLRHASMEAPEGSETVLLCGRGPVATLNGYARELAAYTAGRGSLSLEPDGWSPCHNAGEVIEAAAYRPYDNLADTPDSVFCSHGAGRTVPWNEVPAYMHLPFRKDKSAPESAEKAPSSVPRSLDDRELEAIMLREFGPIKRPLFTREERRLYLSEEIDEDPVRLGLFGGEGSFFLVDGYNLIFSWDELKQLAAADLSMARDRLIRALVNYQSFTGCQLLVVFDAYRVPENEGERSDEGGIHVVYTRERETADAFIERFVSGLGRDLRVRVVTSDALIQLSALRAGVLRLSSREFRAELGRVLAQIDNFIENLSNNP